MNCILQHRCNNDLGIISIFIICSNHEPSHLAGLDNARCSVAEVIVGILKEYLAVAKVPGTVLE